MDENCLRDAESDDYVAIDVVGVYKSTRKYLCMYIYHTCTRTHTPIDIRDFYTMMRCVGGARFSGLCPYVDLKRELFAGLIISLSLSQNPNVDNVSSILI